MQEWNSSPASLLTCAMPPEIAKLLRNLHSLSRRMLFRERENTPGGVKKRRSTSVEGVVSGLPNEARILSLLGWHGSIGLALILDPFTDAVRHAEKAEPSCVGVFPLGLVRSSAPSIFR